MNGGTGGDHLMFDLFRQEAKQHGRVLVEGLGSADGVCDWHALLHAAQSVRSAAALVGFSPVADMCAAVEEALSAAAEGRGLEETAHGTLSEAAGLLVDLSDLEVEEMRGQVEAGASVFARITGHISTRVKEADPEAEAPVPEETRHASVTSSPPADLADASMLDLFRMEAETQARILESGLVELERDASPEKLEVLMRAAHSVKGAARIVGLDPAVTLAHAMEDVLEQARTGEQTLSSAAIDRLLSGNDVFQGLAAAHTGDIPDALRRQAGGIESLARRMRAALDGESDEEPEVACPGRVPGGEPRETPQERTSDGFIRVSTESLNRLMGLAGECLVEARSLEAFVNELLSIKTAQAETAAKLDAARRLLVGRGTDDRVRGTLSEAGDSLRKAASRTLSHMEGVDAFSRRLEQITDRLYNEVIASHMRPFSDGLHGFPRMIRDVSRRLGKKVDLRVVGASTPVDRDILEKLEAPLTHLLRNAVDHGLEPPEEREAAGKAPTATLILEARHRSGLLTIDVRDDGRGVDSEAIRSKIVERGMASGDMARTMSVSELMGFLFLPGFSTAKAVTEISGRGVGLDVVHAMVQEVGGQVRADSNPGRGTVFHLQLPLTRSVVRTLLVGVGGEPLGIPLNRVERIARVAVGDLHLSQDHSYAVIDGANVGLVHARQVLGLEATPPGGDLLSVVLISDTGRRYGLVVDRFLGERDLVVKVLDPRLGKVAGVSAGAVLEDGSPVLIADLDDLLRVMERLVERGGLERVPSARSETGTAKRVLVVDDSLTVREVERRLLESRGFEVVVAVDGMDGWNTLRASHFDLVITDVDMPRLDGIGLTERIKADEALSSTPVMIVSYKDREEDRLRGLEAGADYYLNKSSFHDERLVAAVADLVGES